MASRRGTPREPVYRPSVAAVTLTVLLIGSMLSTILYFALFAEGRDGYKKSNQVGRTHDSMCATYTYDGDLVRWYVMVDPDSGAQYVYNDHSWYPVPRIDRDGSVMGTSQDVVEGYGYE